MRTLAGVPDVPHLAFPRNGGFAELLFFLDPRVAVDFGLVRHQASVFDDLVGGRPLLPGRQLLAGVGAREPLLGGVLGFALLGSRFGRACHVPVKRRPFFVVVAVGCPIAQEQKEKMRT